MIGLQYRAGKKRHGAPCWMSRAALSCVLSVAITMPGWGQQVRIQREGDAWVEETTNAAPFSDSVRILVDSGSIRIEGSPHQGISYTVRKRCAKPSLEAARKIFRQFQIGATRRLNLSVIEGRWAGGSNPSHVSAEILVQVPRGVDMVDVSAQSGTITVRAVSANVKAAIIAGALNLNDIEGSVVASTKGGNINIGHVEGSVNARSGGGNIQAGTIRGRVSLWTAGGVLLLGTGEGCTLQTGAGNIEVRECQGNLRAESGGGSLELGSVRGTVWARNGGGRVRVMSAQGNVTISTGGGAVDLWGVAKGAQVDSGAGTISVQFVGSPHGFSESSLRTASGDVVVYMDDHLPVTVHATSDMTHGAGILSDFSGLKITSEGGDWGPKTMWAEGSLNGGGPVLKVRTTIGQIAFRRTK